MSYYKVIDGKNLDAGLLALAQQSAERGDGRISLKDAELLLDAVKDGGIFTDVERETVEHISKSMRWTPEAAAWFSGQLDEWQGRETQSISMLPEELAKEHFPKEDVLKVQVDRLSREKNLRTATAETYDDHDEISLIVRLADGRRIRVASNFIELEGDFVELRGGHSIPVRAIEKVNI